MVQGTLLWQGLLDIVDGQRGRLFLWLPVGFALGIGLYFALPLEPQAATLWMLAAGSLVGLILTRRTSPQVLPLLVATLAVTLGFLNAGLRAHLVAEPVIGFRYYGPVEGRVVKIDRSASEALRLTLDEVWLSDTPPSRTPARVRVSLHGDQGFVTPEPGMRVAMTAHLSPPPGPTEPGGFDFQRMAWFDRLGAVGYTRTPVLCASEEGPFQPLIALSRLRQALSDALTSRLDGQVGAFAAAILTGDRAAISAETAEALRGANLSHLLAISGLHMGLLTGVVFFASRLALALIPGAALKWPIKKAAALCALIAGLIYLALSGFSVSTERAFVMVSVFLFAIVLDVQALSLRAVALAALILLVMTPEVLTEPGFQMSFAATTALVAVFTIIRRLRLMGSWPPALRGVASVVLSSAVAGIATAPVAAAHFNRIADYGLIANVVSVPVMGMIVMPAAVLALVLWPVGLQGIALSVMAIGIRWILTVAETVSGWEGSVTHLQSPPATTLPLIALGALFVLLWRGRAQHLGVIPVAFGFWLWAVTERPALLISDDGGLVGRMTAEGRALSKPKGAGFAATVWLENDGDLPDQAMAAARTMPALDVGGLRIRHVTGRGWQARVVDACREADLVVVNQPWEGTGPTGGCLLVDQAFLTESGAVAVSVARDGVALRTSAAASGLRQWNTPALRWERPQTARAAQADLPVGVMGMRFDVGQSQRETQVAARTNERPPPE